MTKNEVNDLKQFISTTVFESETRLETRLEAKFNRRFDALETKMDEGFAGVADAIEQINHQLDSHETRITRLEKTVHCKPKNML